MTWKLRLLLNTHLPATKGAIAHSKLAIANISIIKLDPTINLTYIIKLVYFCKASLRGLDY